MENHIPLVKGCNILFNDGRVEYVRPEQIGKLQCKEEEKEEEKE